jgi:hypothetical protein
MKTKRFLLAVGLSLASAFIVSCGTHSFQDFLDELGLGNELRDKIQKLSGSNLLQNGNLGMGFMSGSFPGSAPGSVDVIDTVIVNGRAVEGGSTSITVIATEELEELYISIEGEDGYYVQALDDYDLTEDEKYSYFFIMRFNQELEEAEAAEDGEEGKELVFTVSGKTKSGKVVKETEDEKIVIQKAESGDLQISVSWDQLDDVDLHVITPSRERVNYRNRQAGNVKLDFDSNAGCGVPLDGINSENIYVDVPEDGDYEVEVHLYKKCTDSEKIGARYNVTANSNGTFIEFAPGNQTGHFDGALHGALSDYDDISGAVVKIGTITVAGGRVVN